MEKRRKNDEANYDDGDQNDQQRAQFHQRLRRRSVADSDSGVAGVVMMRSGCLRRPRTGHGAHWLIQVHVTGRRMGASGTSQVRSAGSGHTFVVIVGQYGVGVARSSGQRNVH